MNARARAPPPPFGYGMARGIWVVRVGMGWWYLKMTPLFLWFFKEFVEFLSLSLSLSLSLFFP